MPCFFTLNRSEGVSVAFTKLYRKRFDELVFLRLRVASFTRRRLRLRLFLSAKLRHQKSSAHRCAYSFVWYEQAAGGQTIAAALGWANQERPVFPSSEKTGLFNGRAWVYICCAR